MNSQNSCNNYITLKLLPFEDISNSYIFRFDEFGFRVEEEDGPEPVSNKLLSTPFVEDPQQRYRPIYNTFLINLSTVLYYL